MHVVDVCMNFKRKCIWWIAWSHQMKLIEYLINARCWCWYEFEKKEYLMDYMILSNEINWRGNIDVLHVMLVTNLRGVFVSWVRSNYCYTSWLASFSSWWRSTGSNHAGGIPPTFFKKTKQRKEEDIIQLIYITHDIFYHYILFKNWCG